MAPLEPGTEPALRNILSLDKSTDPLPTQIEEACNILEINLLPFEHAAQAIKPEYSRYGPREEWTLRWLLKKLEGAESNSQSICLELSLWQLLRELVRRLPVANLARLLRAHGFINIVIKTLRALENALPIGESPAKHGLPSSNNGMSREASPVADSSSATVDVSVELSKTSKKRKRDGTMVNHRRSDTTNQHDIGSLYASICDVTNQMQALVKDDSHGYAIEHLKMALRASPEEAAEILSIAFTIANHVLWSTSKTQSLRQEESLHLSLDPWIEIWTCRSRRTVRTAEDLAFSTTSFIPTLKLLSTLNDLADAYYDFADEMATLGGLLLQHIIFPARDSFENLKRPRAAQVDEAMKRNVDQLLAPLQDPILRSKHRDHSQDEKFPPIARFYGIVLQHTPLATPKQRMSEKAWLEFLLDRIALQACTTITDAPHPTLTPHSTDALKIMLKMLAEMKIKLGIAILEQILSQYSHILEKESHKMDWDIVGLCLDIDPDVFVIPTISRDASVEPARRPNKYLSALFQRINEFSLSPDATSELIRGNNLEVVLVPLVKGFAQARDLVGFINHWRHHLVQYQRLAHDPDKLPNSSNTSLEPSLSLEDGQSMWEDERLLRAVASQAAQRMTIEQIEAILQESGAALRPTNAISDQGRGMYAAANLIILDCILHSCRSENTITKLAGVIEKLYTTLLASCEADSLPSLYSQRAWRCIATIKSRWTAELDPSYDVQKMEKTLASKALNLLSHIDTSCVVEKLLQSLNFVLSVIESPVSSSRRELADMTVKAVKDVLRTYMKNVALELSQRIDSQPPFSKPSKRIPDLPLLVESCISQLCLRPSALQYDP
ncbi:MAG: hypothetical protein Q9225_006550 [Loekoesia sp. 1 TL-2023]